MVHKEVTLFIQIPDQIGNKFHHLHKWLFISSAMLFAYLALYRSNW